MNAVLNKVQLRPFNPSQDFAALAQLFSLSEPEFPVTAEMLAHWDGNRNPQYYRYRQVAELSGQVVAVVGFEEDAFAYEEGKYWLELVVHPNYRGLGLGGWLYEHLLQAVRQAPQPLRKWVVSFKENQPAALRFAQKRGFAEEWRRYDSRLSTATFDLSPFAPLLQQVQSRYHVQTLSALLNETTARQLWELDWILFQDVPMGVKFTRRSYEQWRKEEIDDPHFAQDGCFIALDPNRNHPLTGSMVAYTSLQRNPSGFWMIGMTGVLPEYRGQGLAKALKLKGIEYVQQHGGEEIRTFNDPPNKVMYGMNLALGFVPHPAFLRYSLALEDAINHVIDKQEQHHQQN